jgi:ribosomal peptide maturation radical SAM protein 1
MFRIALVNMPFSAVNMPSIALTQLQSAAERRFGAQVAVEICYLSNDFCRRLGSEPYRHICDEAAYSGLGDWLFRQAAFPWAPDNGAEYGQRHFPAHDVRRAGFERLLQFRGNLDPILDELIAKYRLADADLVGFTTMFGQNVASFALARKLKQRKPELVVAIGGANCESPMGEEIARNVDAVDYVFSGPGLLSFPRLLECLMTGDRAAAERIDGVFTRGNCPPGQPPAVAVIGAELPIDDEVSLDYGPFLDALERTPFDEPTHPVLLFETSRGCWWGARAHCTFCGLNGSTMAFREMSPEVALAQMQKLLAYYPRVKQFNCVDNIMPKEYPRTVFAGLETPPDVSIFYEVKADLTEEDMALMSKAGVDGVQPGIEALATSTLKLMRKGTTSVRNVQFLKHCLTYDIYPAWNLLVGFPGEGAEVYRRYVEVLPRLVHLPPPSGAYPVRFDRFSPYFTQAKQYGLALRPVDFYRMVYPFAAESLANLAYYFADQNVTAPYFMDAAKWLGKLKRALAPWLEAWRSPEGRPRLHFEPSGSTRVLDTRSGHRTVHDVGAGGRRLLAALAAPATLPELPGLLAAPGEPPLDLDAELGQLRAKNLVFEDGQRLVSLVLPQPCSMDRLGRRYVAETVPA